MNMTDPIADFLTRIRNAGGAGLPTVAVPYSKLKARLAEILQREGFIREVAEEGEGVQRQLRLTLKYDARRAFAIQGLKRVSRPGLRRYVAALEAPRVLNGMGISILSTSKGLLTDREARKVNAGGELLCQVW